jgi:hypothetical protein
MNLATVTVLLNIFCIIDPNTKDPLILRAPLRKIISIRGPLATTRSNVEKVEMLKKNKHS